MVNALQRHDVSLPQLLPQALLFCPDSPHIYRVSHLETQAGVAPSVDGKLALSTDIAAK